jgi:hypothetical protein
MNSLSIVSLRRPWPWRLADLAGDRLSGWLARWRIARAQCQQRRQDAATPALHTDDLRYMSDWQRRDLGLTQADLHLFGVDPRGWPH